MEHDVCEIPSKVPYHLRSFHRPSLTTEPVLNADDTLAFETFHQPSVELCPSHWRLPLKRSLKRTLKAILLKEWPAPSPHSPRRSVSHDRPAMMRMRDSDDYITARAANPRTGLISPSLGYLTPRPPETPDSPGAALYIKSNELPPSPTPDIKARPGLKRADEGRKLGLESTRLWKADEHGWLVDTSVVAASPRVTATEAEGNLVSSSSQPLWNADSLVVHMPSAQEPQPYAYPGYSAKQIEAAEFYKQKARRVSSEGHDQRVLRGGHQDPFGSMPGLSGIRQSSTSKPCQQIPHQHVSRSGNTNCPVFHGGHITVAKRRLGPQEFCGTEDVDCHSGAELQAPIFAPFSSPKTPPMRARDGNATEMKTSQVLRQHDVSTVHHVQRKPIDGTRMHPDLVSRGLKDLPRISLVHPALAALPQTHPQRQKTQQAESQTCSFRCARDGDRGVCMERRTPSTNATSLSNHSLFDQKTPDQDIPVSTSETGPQLLEHLVTAIISIIDTCRHVVVPAIPRIGVVEVLRADDRTPQQKMDALKQVFATAGQAIVLLAITALLWHVGRAVIQAFEFVLWPVVLPLKILRWVGGGRG